MYGFFMRLSHVAACSLILLVFSGSCTRKKEIRTITMGEKAEIGPFIYQAYDTAWPLQLGERTPKDRFFIVHVTVTNSGGGNVNIPTLEVIDDQNRSYPELGDGTGVEKWLGLSRSIQPAEMAQGSVVFDVPPKHYRLRVADESDNFMYIDIPLNLNSEAPDRAPLEAPAAPAK
jgi:hypothetical protein